MLIKRERPAPSREAGPIHPRKLPAAKRTALDDNTPRDSAEQLICRAEDAVRDALAAVGGDPDSLPPAARTALAGLLGTIIITRSPRLLTPKQAAAHAGVSAQTISVWSDRYGIGWRRGGRRVVDAAKLDALIVGGRS